MGRPKRKTLEDYILKNTNNMVELGTYRTQFDYMIKVYSQLQYQYDKTWDNFEKGGMQGVIPTNGAPKRNPDINTMDELRKQMNALADRLGLTPKALDSIKSLEVVEESQSDKVMQKLNEILKSGDQ